MKHAPVWYDNPAWIKPFEFIMGLVALPKYGEFDPSPVLAVFFPLFFGIMVGDIGYGIVILAIGLYVRHRVEANTFFGNMARVLIISSVPTIVFGYLFGEFFGNFGEIMGWMHPVHLLGISWNRVEAIIPMLILAIAIGVIHVFFGLIIGMRNAIITKSRKHFAERSGMILAITGIILLLVTAAGALPAVGIYSAAVLMIIGFPLILYGAGAFGDHRGDEHGGKHPLLCPADGNRHGIGDPRDGGKRAGGSPLRSRSSASSWRCCCTHSILCLPCSAPRSTRCVCISWSSSRSSMTGAGWCISRLRGGRRVGRGAVAVPPVPTKLIGVYVFCRTLLCKYTVPRYLLSPAECSNRDPILI